MSKRPVSVRMDSVKARIEELKNQQKLLENEQKVENRKARTKRLIDRGAILESLIEGAAELTNDQITSILKKTVGSSFGEKILAQTKEQKTKTATIPQGETPVQNDDAADNQTEIANESGGNVSALRAENATEDG